MPATTEPLAFPGHSHCLFCGELNPHSLRLVFRASDDGAVETEFTAPETLQGYDGMVHGGILASLMDAAMTHCLFHLGIRAYTGDLRVRFLRPVPWGRRLAIRAARRASRGPVHRLESEIWEGGEMMARASATFMESMS